MDKKIIDEIKSEIKEDEIKEGMFVGFNEKKEKQIFYKLFEYEGEDGKCYLAYTDNSKDEKGNIKVYGSEVINHGDHQELKPITTEKEWRVIEKTMEILTSKLNEDNNEE